LVSALAGDLEVTEEVTVSRRWRTILGTAGLLFCGLLILLITYTGKSDNSLHASSLAWAWTGFLGILAGIGFGAIAQFIPVLVAKK
jgi:hypothetical protein